jgi:L,D-transpeptidase catalytic domain
MRAPRATAALLVGLAALAVTACSAPGGTAVNPVADTASTPAAPLARSVTPAPTTTSPPAPPCDSVQNGSCVSLSAKLAWLMQDGKVTFGPVPMMPGAPDEPTPIGTFRVQWKAKHYTSHEFHEPMPNAVFFAAGGVAFHTGSLDNSSHGCVHLAEGDAAKFFDTLPVGATVQVVA